MSFKITRNCLLIFYQLTSRLTQEYDHRSNVSQNRVWRPLGWVREYVNRVLFLNGAYGMMVDASPFQDEL
jgi:Mg2+ and Co2+ transporter CorA